MSAIGLSIDRIFAGYDAGHYSIPEDWDTTRGALRALDVQRRERGAELRAARTADISGADNAMRLVAAATRRGERVEDAGASVVAARNARAALEAEAYALESGYQQAERELHLQLVGESDLFIVDHLRPALDETVRDARLTVLKFPGTPWDDTEAMVEAPDATRAAWTRLKAANARYDAIRGARQALAALQGEPWLRQVGIESAIRNIDELWHPALRWQQRQMPWPDGPLGRLAWLVDPANGAALWVPTRAEQGAAQNLAAPGVMRGRT
ncbi:MAG: hypothetical protein DLM71_06445 [Chloroflexi bacterium]|nr:MAG: hypothetical protein DLM71_06445 [Chloroflexota bacterium]